MQLPMTNWTDVPIPRRMRALQKDRRGYPIPYTVYRDAAGKPHFAINNDVRTHQVIREKRCAICGYRLDTKTCWFVGGPGSAFHEDGAYMDTALHTECKTYALQVCPYLAAPKYAGRVYTGTLDPNDKHLMTLDATMDPNRPSTFVAVLATGFDVKWRGGLPPYLYPHRPYSQVEYWRYGVQVSGV